MGNIQIISRGAEWVVIQRGNLSDLSTHQTLDEALSVARDVAARCGAKLVPPTQA